MYVGVDGGGTRARAVLLDARGIELGRVEGGAGIIDAADPAAGAASVLELARAVAARAGVPVPLLALCCGLAGAGRPAEREAVRVSLLLAGIAGNVVVTGDAEVAMADAFGDAPGVLLIAGTGSIAWARGAGGNAVRVGGWGREIGDEGSAWWLGVAALQCVLRAYDGRGPATSLTGRVLAAAECVAPPDLVRFVAGARKWQLAALAPHVIAAAAEGDAVALRLRDEAVRELVGLVVTAARRAGLAAPAVACAGALVAPGGPLHGLVRGALAAALPGAAVLDRQVDAARGAALLALRAVP
jgi:glucosamine kinase